MPTVNEQILASQVAHQIGLERLKAGTARELLALLDDLEEQLLRQLEARIARAVRIGYDQGPFRTRDLERRAAAVARIRDEVARLASQRFGLLGRRLNGEMVALNGYEVDFQQRLVSGVTGGEVLLVAPSAEILAAAINAKPLHGRLMSQWVKDLAAAEVRAIEQAVNTGLVSGSGTDAIVRDVLGRLRVSRRHAETWVRSAIGHTTQEARDALYVRNKDVVGEVVWLSTLDNRTSTDCIVRDGLRYRLPDFEPVGHSVPWGSGPGRRHPRCRSTSTPWLGKISESGYRASKYGPVPRKVTIREWAETAPRADVERLLGKRRAALLLSGQLSVEDMFSARGDLYSLDRLREVEGLSAA